MMRWSTGAARPDALATESSQMDMASIDSRRPVRLLARVRPGTMRARDYRRKFAAYYRYRDTGRFQRDYTGFPTILVVTSGTCAESRIARVINAAAMGRQPPLPVLITTLGWIEGHPEGLLGPVWRETG